MSTAIFGALSIVQGPFSAAPCQTLIARFARCCSHPLQAREDFERSGIPYSPMLCGAMQGT
jgi:hypothetical protein